MNDFSTKDVVATLEERYHHFCRMQRKEPLDNALPGASNEAIAKFESEAGFRLPPSYRAFLHEHDGWENCAGNVFFMTLEEQLELFKRIREKAPEEMMFMIGLDSSGNNICLDLESVRANGEMKLIVELADTDGEQVVLTTFGDYLHRLAQILKAKIRDLEGPRLALH